MPSPKRFSWTNFRHTPVIGILRGQSAEVCRNLALVCIETEFHTLEVTMNSPGAADIIRELREDFPDLNIGAGTVCNLEDYELAVAAGAQFIVMPLLDEEVILGAVAENIPVFPGAFTPTEIYRAWSLGAAAVKVFPAGQLGPDFVRDVSAPFPDIKLLPTGGVTRDNVGDYFAAGAVGVGMGSGLLDKALLARNDYAGLRDHFRAIRRQLTY